MVYRRRFAQPKKRFNKRGFGVDLQVGRNVPFVGGSKLRIGTRAVKKVVRRELNKREETKIFSGSTVVNSLIEGQPLTAAIPQFIAEGVDENQRTGRKVFLRHLTLKGYAFSNQPVLFRVLVWWSEKTYAITASNPMFPNCLVNPTDIFLPSSGSYVRGLINNKLGNQIICDKIISVNPTISSQSTDKSFKYDCSIMQNLQYLSASVPSNFSDKQLYVTLIPHSSTSAGSSSPINGGIAMNYLVSYKDA